MRIHVLTLFFLRSFERASLIIITPCMVIAASFLRILSSILRGEVIFMVAFRGETIPLIPFTGETIFKVAAALALVLAPVCRVNLLT